MKRPIEEALVRCLARLEEGSTVGEALRGQEAMAAELRPLLEAAYKLRTQANSIEEYRPNAFERGRSRMHAVRASRGASARAPFAGLLSWRPVGLAALAVVVALLALLGSTTGVFHFGAGTTSAYLEGVVSKADPNTIVLSTPDGDVTVQIGEGTVVLDAAGKVISGGDIVPGMMAKVEVEEDGTFLARRIEMEHDGHGHGHGAEVEFSGTIQTIGSSALTVQASFGVATVHLDSQTEVNGTLSAGGTIDVHAMLQDDGSYLAREIDVQEATGDEDGGPGGGENGGDHGNDGSGMGDQGSGDGGNSMNDGSGMGDQGSGDGGSSMNDSSGTGDQGSGDSGQSQTDDHGDMNGHADGSDGDSMGSQ
jgi:hypothetical protein